MANEGGKHNDIAREAAILRTIPDTIVTVAVATANGTADLTVYRGRWIYIKPRGGDVTIKRGAAITTAGAGLLIADGKVEEFFVDPSMDTTLNHWGSAACNLDILYDSKLHGG